MPLLARSVQTPLHIDVRRGAVSNLAAILSDGRISAGGDVAVVVGPGQGERVADLIRPTLKSADVYTTSGGTLDAAMELGGKLRSRPYDAVVGIGGGKTVDTAKYAATRWALPMVSVATSLANDGVASPVASLINDGIKGSYGVHIPIAVIVDLDFVEDGPDDHSRAGIGDVISNISALADWELAREMRGEPVDGLAATLARMGAEAVLTALFCTFLRGDERRFAQMADCLRRHRLPRTAADVGLDADQFVEVVEFAPRTRPDRYTILEHLAMSPAEIRRKLDQYVQAVADR